MNFTLLRFLGVISKYIQPFVMLWDDIHFADKDSLNLLELILTDYRLLNVMIIACYRSNEVEDGHSVTEMLRAIDEKDVFDSFQISKIFIGNLGENHSHQIVMDLLGMDDSCTADLASICHRKTAGNPFFLVFFMTLLCQQKMIEFNLGLMKWTWDLAEIMHNIPATSNVVDMIQQKLESLSSSQRSLLIYASFLGPFFSKDTICLVWNNLEENTDNQSVDLHALLESSVKDGIFEITYCQNYRFVHDKARECANSLINPDQLPLIRHRIGRTLLSGLDEGENVFFVALKLLNQGSPPAAKEERIDLAQMNLKAARKMIDVTGFEMALKYVERGLSLLPSDSQWTECYAISLEFCDIGAETCAVLGDIGRGGNYCDEILQHAKSVDDKFRIYFLKMDSLLRQSLFHDAIDLGLSVLKDHDIRFPQNPVHRKALAILELRRCKKLSKGLCIDKLTASDIITDARQLGIMRIMYKVCV
jgi:predicted ATPase